MTMKEIGNKTMTAQEVTGNELVASAKHVGRVGGLPLLLLAMLLHVVGATTAYAFTKPFSNSTPQSVDGTTAIIPVTVNAEDVSPGAFVAPNTSSLTVDVTFSKIADDGTCGPPLSVGTNSPFNSEMSILLRSPSGTTVDLITAGDYSDDITQGGQVDVTFNESSLTILGTSPASGTFNPTGNLGIFNGQPVVGNWNLEISDNLLNGPVCFVEWTLNLEYWDFEAPNLVSFSSTTSDGVYGPGSVINVTATYDEEVEPVSTASVNLNNTVSGLALGTASRSKTITGSYTVGATASGEDTLDLSVLSIAAHNAEDFPAGNQNLQNSTTLPGTNITDGSAIVIDTTAPLLQSFTSTSSDDTYGPGAIVNVTANYSENLDPGSSINVVLNNGASLSLSSVSGTQISGSYTVEAFGTPGRDTATLTVASISSQNAVDTALTTGNVQTGTALPGTNIDAASAIGVDTTPNISVAVDNATISENALGVAIFTASSNATSGVDVTVTLDFSTGTALLGTDFGSSSSIVITAGQKTGTAAATATFDTLDEFDETIIADISTVINGIDDGSTATSTILDDDLPPTVTLSNLNPSTTPENGGFQNVEAALSAVSGKPVTITLGFSGTATFGSDYLLPPLTNPIVIPAGNPSGTALISVNDDNIDEFDETIIVAIDSVTNGTESGTQQQTTTITDDDDEPVVTLSLSGSPLAEEGGVATVTANMDRASEKGVTVNLATSGTASAGDFTLPASISIAAGPLTTGSVSLTGVGDLSDEDDETVVVDISSVTNGTEGVPGQVTATITDDDDPPNVTLSVDLTSISEPNGQAVITATVDEASGKTVTVNLLANGSSDAVDPDDYTLASSSIVLAPGQVTGTTTLDVQDDALDEFAEDATIDIDSITNGTEATPQSVTVTIQDDDPPAVVTIRAASLTFSETGADTMIFAELDTPSGKNITVNLAYSGTADNGGVFADYEFVSGGPNVFIPAGGTVGSFEIRGLDDVRFEDDETIVIDIDTIINGDEGTPNQLTITLTDDDENLDSDGDGISNADECPGEVFPCPDGDGDGIPDYLESSVLDTDNDGSTDDDDNDSDGDSILDGVECGDAPDCIDTDGDLIPDYVDADNAGPGDSDADTIDDTAECPLGWPCPDTDGDMVPDYTDLDSDNDNGVIFLGNLSDEGEGGDANDADGDGIPDRLESAIISVDGDTETDDQDTDSDGDGILDSVECPNSPYCPDTDGDGIPDVRDIDDDGPGAGDSDGDGVNDDVECPLGVSCPVTSGFGRQVLPRVPDYASSDSDSDGIDDGIEEPLDTDGDGLSDRIEANDIDTDGDGLKDFEDSDSDNDGKQDGLECPDAPICVDTDQDGIPDVRDADDLGPGSGDSDADGILDEEECPFGYICPDFDGDMIPDYMDLDSDADGISDLDEGSSDADSDGMPDRLESVLIDSDGDGLKDQGDSDSDNENGNDGADCDGPPSLHICNDDDGDGIPDHLDGDSGGALSGDTDGDTISDAEECRDGFICPDTDGDMIPDYADLDSDGDGIPDTTEGTADNDADNVPNRLENNNIDRDGDGQFDPFDANDDDDTTNTAGECPNGIPCGDDDGDLIPNHIDFDDDGPGAGDSDGDGIADDIECEGGPLCLDSDDDGTPNYFDTDSDDDGIPDATEGTGDPDGDDIPNYLDDDSDGDGLLDVDEGAGDSDGDGIIDALDDDSDNDGISDVDEGTGDSDGDGLADSMDADADNDGIPDSVEGTGDTDGDTIPDNLDIDSDGDGVPDLVENQPTGAVVFPSGSDDDNDGVDNAFDADNGGTPLSPIDTDGDATADSLDTDSDNDGALDVSEAHDQDQDGTPDIVPSGLDTDGDGLDDAFDDLVGPGFSSSNPHPAWRSSEPFVCQDLTAPIDGVNAGVNALAGRVSRILRVRRSVSSECGLRSNRRRDTQIRNRVQVLLETILVLTSTLPTQDEGCENGSCVELDQTATTDEIIDQVENLRRVLRAQIRGNCARSASRGVTRQRRFINSQRTNAIDAANSYPSSVIVCE